MQTTQTEIMPGISESAVIATVRAFVQENFLYMMPDFELADDDRLLEKGVVDSMGISEMISFIEAEFGVVAAHCQPSWQGLARSHDVNRLLEGRDDLRTGRREFS